MTTEVFHFHTKPRSPWGTPPLVYDVRNLVVAGSGLRLDTRLGEYAPAGPGVTPLEIPITPHPTDHHLFILEGEGEIRDKDATPSPLTVIYPGCAVFLEKGHEHAITNTGASTLKLLSVKLETT